jgi:methyl-accepting chemotaxis protein
VRKNLSRSRRKYFINRAIQLDFMLRLMLLVAFGSIITGFILYYYMSRQLSSEPEIIYRNTMLILRNTIIFTQLIVGVVVFIVIGYVTLYFSHRIAGPLYRLEKIMDQVGDGDLTVKVVFRKKDALLHLKTSMQYMIDNLQFRISHLRDSLEEFKKLKKEMHASVDNSSLPEQEKEGMKKDIDEYAYRCETSIGEFKLPRKFSI